MNNYDKRWNFVLKWATKVKSYLDQGYILYDGHTMFDKDEFIIEEGNRYLGLKKGHAQYMLFDSNLDFDHGAYTPIHQLKEELSEYTLMKTEQIDLFK